MSAEDSGMLSRRVGDLENEVRALRQRVAALEGVEFTEPVTQPLVPVPLIPVMVAPPSISPPRPPVAPPPIPVSALVPPVAAATPVSVPPKPVVPPTPVPPPIVRPAEPAAPSALAELLRALHLLPPSGQGSGEAQIGTWWATRIGALLVVIGVVFFGVYISLNTPPWVKLVELAVIAGGVTLGGLWIERRIGRLGSVILGAGLALCFFTAFAAYAVPAVKVVESIQAGAILQAMAVVAIGGAALWRRSTTVATMAVLLGFVTAFFSLSEGFDDFALVAGLGLSAMAVFFRYREGWATPVILSAGLVHVLTAIVALEVWGTEAGQRSVWVAFAVVGLAFGLHLLSLVLEGGDDNGRVAFVQRWIQAINTSLAVLAGFVVALQVLPEDQYSHFFFGAGAVLIGAAVWALRAVPRDGIFGMFAVKASSLIALGVIAEWDARTRWIALAVQAAVLMSAAWRTGRVSLAITAILAWLVSLLFFGVDIADLRHRLISGDGVAVALYLVGSAALLGWVAGWLKARDKHQTVGVGLEWVLSVGAALPVGMAVFVLWHEAWAMPACVVFSIAMVMIARALRSIVPVISAVVAMFAAHVIVQIFDEVQWGLGWLWAGAALIAVGSAVPAWFAGRRDGGNRSGWTGVAAVLTLLAIAAIGGAAMQSISVHPALAVTVVLAVVVIGAGHQLVRPDFTLAGLSGVPVAVLLLWMHAPMFFVEQGDVAWLWVAAAAVPVALAVSASPASQVTAVARALVGATGVLLAWHAAGQNFGKLGLAWSALCAAGVYLGIGHWRQCGVSRVAASALLALTAAHFVMGSYWASSDRAWAVLFAVFAGLVALALAPLVQRKGGAWLRPGLERPWRVLHAVMAAGCLLIIATFDRAVWEGYGSVVWALGGVLLFVLGLAFRARSHRVVGLVTLGLCIPRVFIYDIQSTSHRIGAFVVLGVLLLIVGFSYQKFRYLIEGAPRPGKSDDSSSHESQPER